MRTKLLLSIVLLILLLGTVGGAYAYYDVNQKNVTEAAVDTGFIFQGQLKSAGSPVAGNCEMTFQLFDDGAAGTQIGNSIATTVPINNSLFTVMLNSNGEFGANAFNGSARWLEVAVKCASDQAFTTLSPRQQIAAVPYAHYALAGSSANLSTWIQQTPRNMPPDPRGGSAYSYDNHTDRLILFGGANASYQDVWVLENASGLEGTSAWVQLFPSGGPPPGRVLGTAVYDPSSNSLILHGGCAGNCSPALSDTWVLSNANGLGGPPAWTQLPSAPVARAIHTAVYDLGSNRMIVFGGNQAFPGSDRNDVWVLVDANGIGSPSWVQLSPTGAPPAIREDASAIYDPATNRMIVFGGMQFVSAFPYTFIYYNDAWVLTNANGFGGTPVWIQLTPTGLLPAAREGFSLTYDPNSNRITLFGGLFQTNGSNPNYTFFNDVWVLTEANGVGSTPQWIQIVPNGNSITERSDPVGGYSLSSNRLIIYTGANSGSLNDVWLLTNANGLVR